VLSASADGWTTLAFRPHGRAFERATEARVFRGEQEVATVAVDRVDTAEGLLVLRATKGRLDVRRGDRLEPVQPNAALADARRSPAQGGVYGLATVGPLNPPRLRT
jgi:hypothetical protein